MHPRLVELTEYLAQQRRAVLAAAAVVPTERWREQPAPDRWSVSHIFEHLHRVESAVVTLLTKHVVRARSEGHPAETSTESVLGTLDRFGVSDRSKPLEAPPTMVPTAVPERDAAERLLGESRAALLGVIDQADGLALGEIRQMNRFGELNLYEWILFIGEHEKRHALQIEEVAAQLTQAA